MPVTFPWCGSSLHGGMGRLERGSRVGATGGHCRVTAMDRRGRKYSQDQHLALREPLGRVCRRRQPSVTSATSSWSFITATSVSRGMHVLGCQDPDHRRVLAGHRSRASAGAGSGSHRCVPIHSGWGCAPRCGILLGPQAARTDRCDHRSCTDGCMPHRRRPAACDSAHNRAVRGHSERPGPPCAMCTPAGCESHCWLVLHALACLPAAAKTGRHDQQRLGGPGTGKGAGPLCRSAIWARSPSDDIDGPRGCVCQMFRFPRESASRLPFGVCATAPRREPCG